MAYIDENKINEIRNSVNIVDVIKDYVPLTSKGKNYFGVCPFHEDHAPSMSVSSDKQIYRCFSCGAAGNVFTFVKDYENVSFLEAVAMVAKKAGISFNYSSSGENTTNVKYQNLYNILSDSNKFFQNNLFTDDGLKAIEYIKKRNFTEKDIKEFEFGFSTFGNSLSNFLTKKNYEPKDMERTSLISLEGKTHDVFVGRFMVPIHDLEGRVVGFGGRIIDDSDGPKYINSKETEVFKKGKILFNYHRAKNHIRNNHEILVVEGFMDALKLYSSGVKNVVALMGTALTDDQINIFQKLHSKVVLMMDSDNAGKLGMYQNGKLLVKHNIEVEVVLLSGAKDPDEYINNFGVDQLINVIKKPMSFLNYKLEYLKEGLNLDDVEDLSKYIKKVIEELKTENDKIKTELTVKKLSNDYGLDYDNLMSNFSDKPKETIKPTIVQPTSKDLTIKIDEAVANIILGMITDGKYIKQFVKQLGFLPEKWQRNLINEIRYYYDKNKTINLADFLSYLSNNIEVQSILTEIVSKYGDLEINDEIFNEYIQAEKRILLQSEIKEVKAKLKNEHDVNKKMKLIEELTRLKKEVEHNGSN